MGLGEKSVFSPEFLIVWRYGGYGAKKLINTILAEIDFFPSKNHDSLVFMQLC